MANSSDFMQTGLLVADKIRWCYVDVVDSARAAVQAHLSGPTAALALAEALVGVALISSELAEDNEAVSLRMKVDGPLQGLLVEATHTGHLRGYTNMKVLNQFDGADSISSYPAWGESGEVAIVRSVPGRVISQAGVECHPPMMRQALDNYFNLSLQRDAFAIVETYGWSDGVSLARGLLVECLPEGNRDKFIELREGAADGGLSEALEHADKPGKLWIELNESEVNYDVARPLRFACRCSRASALAALAALPLAERHEIASRQETVDIDCHMCGTHYGITPEEIAGL